MINATPIFENFTPITHEQLANFAPEKDNDIIHDITYHEKRTNKIMI